MNERASTLWESRCLVTGFGRCAKALALLLKGFGARVTVAARKQGDLAFARTLGLQTVSLRQLQEVLPQQEIVFNTIPAPVLTRPAAGAAAARVPDHRPCLPAGRRRL